MPRRKPDERTQARRFGLLLLPILLGLAGIAYWRGHERTATVLAVGSLVPPIVTLALFPLWLRFFRAWMKLAEVMSWVMTRVILSLFYFLFLTPIALLTRIVREDPLDLDWKRRKASYWIDKPAGDYTLERYEKQY